MALLTGSSADGWYAQFLGGQPVVGYRLTDAEGAVADEGSVDVEGVRTGGDERCGGPHAAEIVL